MSKLDPMTGTKMPSLVRAAAEVTARGRVRVKRVYDPATATDGVRVLVDRLWPRGLSKKAARVDLWLKDIGPSHALRRWFGHDANRWDEFRRRYAAELRLTPDVVAGLATLTRRRRVTLLFSSRELVFNNARALREYLLAAPGPRAPQRPRRSRGAQGRE
jgi:uncharacterized protein YeaO (DUF488 family)